MYRCEDGAPHLASTSVKTTYSSSHQVLFTGCSSILCTCVRGTLCASLVYLSPSFWLSSATCGPPKMVRTSLILSRLCWCGLSFVVVTWGLFSKNSLKFHALISLSIVSLRALHFTALCPMSFWYAQFFPDISPRPVIPDLFWLPEQVIVCHYINVISRGIEGMIICIFWKWCSVFSQPTLQFLWAFSSFHLSSSLVFSSHFFFYSPLFSPDHSFLMVDAS